MFFLVYILPMIIVFGFLLYILKEEPGPITVKECLPFTLLAIVPVANIIVSVICIVVCIVDAFPKPFKRVMKVWNGFMDYQVKK